LRHPFMTAALDAGAPLRDVQKATSHASPHTSMSGPGLAEPARHLCRRLCRQRRLVTPGPPGSRPPGRQPADEREISQVTHRDPKPSAIRRSARLATFGLTCWGAPIGPSEFPSNRGLILIRFSGLACRETAGARQSERISRCVANWVMSAPPTRQCCDDPLNPSCEPASV
jgi:hypothetical protein